MIESATTYRTLITQGPPYSPRADEDAPPWQDRSGWRCRWIAPSVALPRPVVVAYRCRFTVNVERSLRVHVTADERYELYLDGERIGRGPERGEPEHWFFETYDLPLTPGDHVLGARVWSLGSLSPWAQRSVAHGLLVAPQDADGLTLIGTGLATWECKLVEGIRFTDPSVDVGTATGVGPAETVDAAGFSWGTERGDGEGWQPVVAGEHGNDGFTLMAFRPGHRLRPATLPHMMGDPLRGLSVRRSTDDRLPEWQALLDRGSSVTVPPHANVELLIDLRTYGCFYPKLQVSGGARATLSLTYAESLHPKGQRDTIDGRTIKGLTDQFSPDGLANRTFAPLWWRCGRYVELRIRTGPDPVDVSKIELRETRYPLSLVTPPRVNTPDLSDVLAMSRRTLEMCCHETYMDCPHYEQLMYIGDTRIQCLMTYAHSHDSRPPVKALKLFDRSRMNFNGLPTDAAPGDAKFIPPFALIWIGMVHDFARYRDDVSVVLSLMPGVRAVLERFSVERSSEDGLIHSPAGWNFLDWADSPFRFGVPPGGETGGLNASLNLLMLAALRQAAELERHIGEPELAARWRRLADDLNASIRRTFLDDASGLVRETPALNVFTEHAQCLAIASGAVEDDQRRTIAQQLATRTDLTRCSLYFTHYLFDVLHRYHRPAAFFARFRPWYELVGQGFVTTPESFGNTRSDCHAWSAHPLFHVVASIAGIRPAGFGFDSVHVQPMLGPLRALDVTTPHPRGEIQATYRVDGPEVGATIDLRADVHGTLSAGGESYVLRPGLNVLRFRHDWPTDIG